MDPNQVFHESSQWRSTRVSIPPCHHGRQGKSGGGGDRQGKLFKAVIHCRSLSFTVVHCHSLITVSVTFIIFGLSSASPFLEVYALDGDALTVPLSYVLSTVRPLNVPTTW
jgi:hypothetical protein